MSSSEASDISTEIINIAEEVEAFDWRQPSDPVAKRQRIVESLNSAENNFYYPDIELNEEYISDIENSFIYMSGQQTNGNALSEEQIEIQIKLEPDLRSAIKEIISMKENDWTIIRHDSKGTGDWIDLNDYLTYFLQKTIVKSPRLPNHYINRYYWDLLTIVEEVVSESDEQLLYERPQTSDTSIQSNNNESLTDTPIASTSTAITSHSSTNNFTQNSNSIKNAINIKRKIKKVVKNKKNNNNNKKKKKKKKRVSEESNELSHNLISNEVSDENVVLSEEEVEVPSLSLDALLFEVLKSFQISIKGMENKFTLKKTNNGFYFFTFELTEELIKNIEKASLMKILIYIRENRNDFEDNGCYTIGTTGSYCKCGEIFIAFLKTIIVPMFPNSCTTFEDINNQLNLIYTKITISDTFIEKSNFDIKIYSLQSEVNSNLFDNLFLYIFKNEKSIDWTSNTTVSSHFITNIQLNRSSDSVSNDSEDRLTRYQSIQQSEIDIHFPEESNESEVNNEPQTETSGNEDQEWLQSEEPQEWLYSEEPEESLHSAEPEESLHSEEPEESLHSEEPEESLHSEEPEESLNSEEPEESLHSEEPEESLHSEEPEESLHSEEQEESLHSEEPEESLYSEEPEESLYSEEPQESDNSLDSRVSHESVESEELHESEEINTNEEDIYATDYRPINRSDRLEVEIQTENIQTNSCETQTEFTNSCYEKRESETQTEFANDWTESQQSMESEIESKLYLCVFCRMNRYFVDKSQAKEHFRHHLNVVIRCEECYTNCENPNTFSEHLEHSEQNLLNLKQYYLSVDWIESFLNFQMTETFTELIRISRNFCSVCNIIQHNYNTNPLNNSFETNDSFDTHLRKHFNYNSVYECLKCRQTEAAEPLFRFCFSLSDAKTHLLSEHKSDFGSELDLSDDSIETNFSINQTFDKFLETHLKSFIDMNKNLDLIYESNDLD